MSELSDMAGASRPVVLGGKEYYLSPLSLGDFAEFDAWAEEQFWRKTEQRVARMPEGLRATLLERAYSEIDEGAIAVNAMITIAGTARLVWLSLRKRHPELTPAQAADLVTLDTRQRVQAILDRLNGMEPTTRQQTQGNTGVPPTPAAAGAAATRENQSRSENSGERHSDT